MSKFTKNNFMVSGYINAPDHEVSGVTTEFFGIHKIGKKYAIIVLNTKALFKYIASQKEAKEIVTRLENINMDWSTVDGNLNNHPNIEEILAIYYS